jgi:hypothetical protein
MSVSKDNSINVLFAQSLFHDEQVPVAAVPRWEPETVNSKDLQVTKSLETSPTLKNWR